MPDDHSHIATLRSPTWYETATRWSQLTLVENDPPTLDVGFWLDVFRQTRSNAACLSAGGYIAYYPSKIPYHYVSRFIGSTDPFGALVAGARSLDMHVMARIDPHAIHDDAAMAHPEWLHINADGSKRRHWAFPEVWVTCALGDYNRLFTTEVIREIVTNYDVDAIFANRWSGHGLCYCASCRGNFKSATGHDVPPRADPADAAWRAYVGWRRATLTALIVHWNEAVQRIRPNARFIPNLGQHSFLEFDLDVIRRYAPILLADHQGRSGTLPPWAAAFSAKRMRASMGDCPIGAITSVGPEAWPRWKDSVQSAPETELWIAEGAAHGMRPWFTKFAGAIADTRWVAPVVARFQAHAELAPKLEDTAPWAEIALLDPSTTLRNYEAVERTKLEEHERGIYHALVEARLPFDLINDHKLADLHRYKAVIIGNAPFLSDEQCSALRHYVEQGGGLVATHETSFCDESGQRRPQPGLADLFAIRTTGPARGMLKNTYLAIDRAAGHPLTEGFDGAERIMGGTRHIPVEPLADSQVTFRLFPDFPDLPMEEVYARESPRDAAVVSRSLPGGGRVVYLPWNIGEIFWDVMHPDHGRLIANALRWVLRDRPAVELHGAGILDIAVRRAPGRLSVHLVNLTNPMLMKGPLREFLPSAPQILSVEFPTPAGSVHFAISNTTPRWWQESTRLLIEIPSFTFEEVVLIETR